MQPRRFTVEARPHIPESLARLNELANDLMYSWNHSIRSIFARLDLELWEQVRHNPKVFLRRIPQERINRAAQDRAYMAEFQRVISAYDSYLAARPDPEVTEHLPEESELVAYFVPSSVCTKAFPSTPGGSVSWQVTTVRRRAILAYPLLPSACSINRVILSSI